jgi:hypothetical protein
MLPQQPGLLASDPVGGDADHHFCCTSLAHLDMITGPTPDPCHHRIASRSAQQTAWASARSWLPGGVGPHQAVWRLPRLSSALERRCRSRPGRSDRRAGILRFAPSPAVLRYTAVCTGESIRPGRVLQSDSSLHAGSLRRTRLARRLIKEEHPAKEHARNGWLPGKSARRLWWTMA